MTHPTAASQALAQNPLQTRAQWHAACAERRAKVVTLRSRGMTIPAVAAALDMTESQVKGALRTERLKARQ